MFCTRMSGLGARGYKGIRTVAVVSQSLLVLGRAQRECLNPYMCEERNGETSSVTHSRSWLVMVTVIRWAYPDCTG